MKVKVGELKTHLSKYLRQIEKDGEPIEVCVREDTVAYLAPAKALNPTGPKQEQMAQQLEAAGIQVSQWGSAAPLPVGAQGNCGHPTGGHNSVESIRQERNW